VIATKETNMTQHTPDPWHEGVRIWRIK
jgi:hypothetical protein